MFQLLMLALATAAQDPNRTDPHTPRSATRADAGENRTLSAVACEPGSPHVSRPGRERSADRRGHALRARHEQGQSPRQGTDQHNRPRRNQRRQKRGRCGAHRRPERRRKPLGSAYALFREDGLYRARQPRYSHLAMPVSFRPPSSCRRAGSAFDRSGQTCSRGCRQELDEANNGFSAAGSAIARGRPE